jgi:hypothetical protein
MLSVAHEHAIFDFKSKYETSDPTTPFEIAKDVCAFANHLGGTILVGACEGKGTKLGRIVRFGELTDPSPRELVKEVDRAISLYCRPVPIVDVIQIPLDAAQVAQILDAAQVAQILGRSISTTLVVAINVPPMLNTPVGCLSCSDECKQCKDAGQLCACKGKPIADAFRFPIRTIETTRFLRPDELARTMNVIERRALLDLQAIQGEEKILVWFNPGDKMRHSAIPCIIESLNSEIMVCTLKCLFATPPRSAEIPLTFIRATWKSSAGWNVAVDGIAFEGSGHTRQGFFPPGGMEPHA